MSKVVPRDELEATIEARRELGREHEDHLIDGFLDRIGAEIDRRVDERIAQQAPRVPAHSLLGPATLGICIPIIAIAGGIAGTAGLIAAFAALVIVFAIATHAQR